jgi:CelD/BcsL family acetyltransferase involved in cellulose biosynthesis
MGWELKPACEAFPDFAAEWDRLNGELYDSHPMFDSRFVGPLLKYFGKGNEKLCIHRAAGKVDGALILRPIGLGRWELFLPAQAQAGPILLREGRWLESLFESLPNAAWSIDLLAIDPEYSPDWTGLRLPRTVTPHQLTMAVALDGDFAGYWQSRPRNLAKNMRRYQHRAETRLGTPKVTAVTHRQQIGEALVRYSALEMSGWKGKAGSAVGIDNPQGRFYLQSLEAFADSGQARIIELHIGAQLAASRLIIRNKAMWIILKTAYAETLAALAPGRLLLREVLHQAFARQAARAVEFYTDANRDQTEWATSVRYTQHHQLYRGSFAAVTHNFVRAMKNPLKKHLAKPDRIAIDTYAAIADLPADAVRLMDAAARDNMELSTAWFANLQQTVYKDYSGVRYCVARSNDQAAAVLPVRLTRHGWIRSIESLSNYYTSLYSPILAPRAGALDLARLLKQAITARQPVHVMRFLPMAPDTPAFEALLAALRSIGWVPFRFLCFGNWTLKVQQTWAEYLKEREGKLRSTLKRMSRKFVTEGGTLEIVTGPGDVETAIGAFNSVYAQSWKKPEPYPEFVPGLIRWLAASRQLRLGIARLNGRPIAAQLWIVANGKASIFKLAYDETYASYSPGTLLTAHLMEHVIDRDGVGEVDYLIGDDEHKKAWMNQRRERWGIIAYNPTTVSGLALMAREIVGRTLRKAIQMTHSENHASTRSLRWEIAPIGRFGEYAARWDAFQRACANIPFLESAFLLPLLEEFGGGNEMLALAYEGEKPCAAAILYKKRPGIWQTFQPAQLPLGAWVSRPDVDIAGLGKSLLRVLPGTGLSLSITQLDPLFQPRPVDDSLVRTQDYINTAWVEIDQAFDAYWESRGKNLKTNTRKQRAKLQGEGVVLALECITAPADVARALDDYGALESGGWKGKDGTAVHPDNAQGRFYRKMLESFGAQGRGRIYRYRFNDKVVAMDLCIESGDRIVILKTAYDESYKTVSPSTLMRQDEFQEFFREGRLKRIEFYGKVMDWHTRWTENARTLYHLTAYRWPILNSLHRRLNEIRQPGNHA